MLPVTNTPQTGVVPAVNNAPTPNYNNAQISVPAVTSQPTPVSQPTQASQPGKYLDDLGKSVKAKYPGAYDDLPDSQVGQLIQQKYPGSYDDYKGVDPANSAAHPGFWGGVKDVGLGILKGLGQVGENVDNAVLRPIANAVLPGHDDPTHSQMLDTHNSQQRIGKAIGETAPYLVTPELEGAGIITNSLLASAEAGSIAGVQGQNPIVPALTAGIGTAITKYGANYLKGLQDTLETKNLNVTPKQAQKLGGQLDQIVNLTKKFPVGTPQARAGFAQDLANDFDQSFTDTIQSAAAQPVASQIPKAAIIDGLKALPQKFAGEDSGFIADLTRKVNQVVNNLKALPDYLSLDAVNAEKIGASSGVYEPLSGKVRDAASDAITDYFRQTVAQGAEKLGVEVPLPESIRKIFPGLPETMPVNQFNQLYSTILRTKDVLANAETKNQVSFWTRFIADTMGGLTGHAIGGVPGAVAGEIATNKIVSKFPTTVVRSAIGKAATKAAPILERAYPKVRVK